jgi:SAM-dependent methyltransferase
MIVERCQICGSIDLKPIFFAGYLPPVNGMPAVGERVREEQAFPAELLRCQECSLVQLGFVVDPEILFPPSYPYTSGTTRILRENFSELREEIRELLDLKGNDLVVDVGSNDGTLLKNFTRTGQRVCGVEPTDAGVLARRDGIETFCAFFDRWSADVVRTRHGAAHVVTATNVFAHIPDPHNTTRAVLDLLADDGLFVTESHYVASLLETVQYDTIYHEHLRYYSLGSLSRLLGAHDLEVVHAKKIPTHGGSLRVYAARRGRHRIRPSVAEILEEETRSLSPAAFQNFQRRAVDSKINLYVKLAEIRSRGWRVWGVGAPSRASTLVNYVGLDADLIECVLEVPGSYKIGKYLPGTLIPVVDESRLREDPPDVLLLLSWHIAGELMPKLRERGFSGHFLVPLPEPEIID